MQQNVYIYEYITVYVDDLLIVARDTKSLMDSLEIRYKFKLKGKGLLEFHLRCDFFCDRNGVIYFEPHIYFGNMVHTYMTMFG